MLNPKLEFVVEPKTLLGVHPMLLVPAPIKKCSLNGRIFPPSRLIRSPLTSLVTNSHTFSLEDKVAHWARVLMATNTFHVCEEEQDNDVSNDWANDLAFLME